jgi:hypothetical protein
MRDFGKVEDVKTLGSKGNAALVTTFAAKSSCGPCVDTYQTSKAMLAMFVGQRKVDYIAKGLGTGQSSVDDADEDCFPPSSKEPDAKGGNLS